MTDVEDPDIGRILAGDKLAFDQFMQRNLAYIRSVARPIVGDEDASEEIAVGAFAKVYQKLCSKRDKPIQNLRAYTAQIALNLALDERKERQRWQPLEQEGDEDNAPLQRASPTPGPDLEVMAAAMCQRILNAYRNACPDPQDYVILLRTLEGYSQDEIAFNLGMKPNLVATRALRSRRRFLRTVLEQETDLVGGACGVQRSFCKAADNDLIIPVEPLEALFRCFTIRVGAELHPIHRALDVTTLNTLLRLFIGGVARMQADPLTPSHVAWLVEGVMAVAAVPALHSLPSDRLDRLFEAFCAGVTAACGKIEGLPPKLDPQHTSPIWRRRFDRQIAHGKRQQTLETTREDRRSGGISASTDTRKSRMAHPYRKEDLEAACLLLAPYLIHQLHTNVRGEE
jgi:RNA polymerase sigma factor (sigma-70 family)